MKKMRLPLALLTMAGLFSVPVSAYASINVPSVTVKSVQTQATIPVEINGHLYYPGYGIDNETYVRWAAMQLMGTPYTYLGNAKFNVAGKIVQGKVIAGQSYLPYWIIGGTPVKVTRVGAGWNFTRVWQDSATDGYKLQLFYPSLSTTPGVFLPFWAEAFKADGTPIPGSVNIVDTSDTPGYGQGGLNNAPSPAYWPIGQLDAGHAFRSVTWVDPNGQTHQLKITATITAPHSTATPIPADDQVVAQVPITIRNAQILFNSKVQGQPVTWQLDTGAQSPVLNRTDAAKLNLPHEHTITIQGVTGSAQAYTSHMDVTIGGVTFSHVFCLIFPDMQGNSLFGYSFFDGIDPSNGQQGQKYDLLVSEKHNTLTILK